MRVQSFAIICAFASATLAEPAAAEPQHVWTSVNDGRATVYVSLGDFTVSQKASLRLWNPEMKLEWTANGQPMPVPLPSPDAQCIEISAQAYSCEALIHWFKGRYAGGRPGRNLSRIDYPEGFLIKNLDLDTEYCFRFLIAWINDPRREWTQWTCATAASPPPLPRPFAPSQPVLTILPAESGFGQVGDGQPLRILVEWKPNRANNGIAIETVQMFGNGEWHPTAGESRPGEKVIPLDEFSDPGEVYTLRVCARNESGEACSPLARTPGRPWLEKVPAGGKASRYPTPEPQGSDTYDPDTPTAVPANPTIDAVGRVTVPDAPAKPKLSICEMAKVARDRSSPAAPGLAEKCLASGGTVPQ
ncbi:hypothetical protein LZ518_05615 [Sphingomonas sp. RB56-2]|uniref:Fibronectin type III domain-containing protein n=1 Tax=Sphingomonas brevis TaxID=2908206 RepID=A0ABT0S8Y5_9SPHN|nr:hypothetical protein [Sphingomonas brevis]MCL6740609.1 hypothetical protein [Sphingomonas brevis]